MSISYQDIVNEYDTIRCVSSTENYVHVTGYIDNELSRQTFIYDHNQVAQAVAQKVQNFVGI